MSKRIAHRRNATNAAALMAGLGLILLGAALFLLLLRASDGTAASSAEEPFSAIPVVRNTPAPQLSLRNLRGEIESLADYRQNVVMVNNWATWCPPCKAEMPILQAYYEAHKDQGFVLIAIEAGDPPPQVAQFVQAYGLTFTVWLDADNAALTAFKNPNLPNSYVIDRAGLIRYAWTGAISRAMLEKYVTPLLGNN